MADVDGFALMAQFKELQQEKKKLQNRLDHLRFRRKDLESKQSTVDEKNRLLSQKNDSMSRTVQIAKMKVQESQFHVDKLQKFNGELQATVNVLKDGLTAEDNSKDEKLMDIQDKLDNLANGFRGAKDYYAENALEEEIKNWKLACTDREKNIDAGKETASNISSVLDKLNISKVNDEKPKRSEWNEVLEQKSLLQLIFEEEAACVMNRISRETSILQEINQKLLHVQTECDKKMKYHQETKGKS